MSIDQKIVTKFEQLIAAGESLLSTKQSVRSSRNVVVIAPDYVDSQKAEEWGVSSLSFLGRILGKDSEHYQRFFSFSTELSTHHQAERAFAVLKAAFEDYKGGYLFDTQRAIQADVFDEFLEQATYFLKEGYFQVSAVIAGAVLEDTLRRLCVRENLPLSANPKLDVMNADLAKSGLYDKMIQKKITWLADVRNKAAHGKWNEFTEDDSEEMVRAVRRFVEDYL